MKIGILEIMPVGHYTLVDSITSIFTSDTQNEIIIFTNELGAEYLRPIIKENSGNIRMVVKGNYESIDSFLLNINKLNLNSLFVVTLEKYLDIFYKINFNCQISLFIHNIDLWFIPDLKYKIYNILNDFSVSAKLIYKLKVNLIYSKWRKKIVNKLLQSGGRFVVLNYNIKSELKKYVSDKIIDVIPFSVYRKNIIDQSGNNKNIRICIPGLVSQVRRDYFSVIKLIEEEIELFKGKIELDLLGGIVKNEEGTKIIEKAKNLEAYGINIHYYSEPFIPSLKYDEQLSKADIILGNMNVEVNKYSKYGATKETGIIYNMIRAAKPGILPINYNNINELKSSTLTYKDYTMLKIIINSLIEDRKTLEGLKIEAQRNSQLFDPVYIYKNIRLNNN